MTDALDLVLEILQLIDAAGLLFEVDGLLLLHFIDSVLQYLGMSSEFVEVVDTLKFFDSTSLRGIVVGIALIVVLIGFYLLLLILLKLLEGVQIVVLLIQDGLIRFLSLEYLLLAMLQFHIGTFHLDVVLETFQFGQDQLLVVLRLAVALLVLHHVEAGDVVVDLHLAVERHELRAGGGTFE